MYELHERSGPTPATFGIRALWLALLLLALPAAAMAQERETVFNQVTVSSQEAGIELEFADGTSLSARFRDGRVTVNGEEVGRYTPGGPLESSWRGLLGEAVTGDNGEVIRLLREWTPPAGLDSAAQGAAAALTAELSRLLEPPSAPTSTAPAARTLEGSEDLFRNLVLEADYLRALTAAVLEGNVRPDHIALREEFRIPAGERLEGSLLALDSRVEVDGTLEGDLVLLGGVLGLGEDGRITGDVRWSGGELPGDREGIAGRVAEIDPVLGLTDSELRDRIRAEVRSATADARRQATRSRGVSFRGVFGGIADLFQTLVTFAIFLGVSLGVLHFFPRRLDVVSRTASNAPGKSFLVGLSGGVLAFPIWITGMVILAISIIGIPVLLAWIPGFPIVVAGLMILGYIAVSRNVGQWVSRRDFQGMDRMDTSRPAIQIGVGLAALLGVFVLASILKIGGMIFAPFTILLTILGVVLTIAAGSIGLGAVLLSRGGGDPSYAGDPWDPGSDTDPWAPSPDPFTPDPPDSGPAGEAEGAAYP